jgi:hypothetical protein
MWFRIGSRAVLFTLQNIRASLKSPLDSASRISFTHDFNVLVSDILLELT